MSGQWFKVGKLDLTAESTEATLTGATFDGTEIVGTDTVTVLPKTKRLKKPKPFVSRRLVSKKGCWY